MEKLVKVGKGLLILLSVIAILAIIYPGMDFVFKEILSSTSRAVMSNFIVFALVIALVMKNVVHPKSMLEKEQAVIETQIKESETVKEDSEARLSSIENSMLNIEKEIESILKASEDNAKLVGEKILQDGNNTALIIKENAEKAIENSRVILKNDLLKKASLASVEIAKNHIINELSWNQGLHDKLIDESIEAIEGVNQ
ncbi:MAG: ATP synthase F0 subunit B [Cyanobacteria bacterium SIG31]|nr:ATP synthase F0 subunit B [Cyanobacteria bacterium SIG31]